MKILIDILHPGHVHFFRYFIKAMEQNGHEVLITARDKEMTLELLEQYKISYTLISKQRRGFWLGIELLTRTAKMYLIARSYRPDCYLGIMGPSISIVGKLTGRPVFIFYDTEHAKITNLYSFKLAKKVITPDCYLDNIGVKHIRYKGYHELAYLHPDLFHPDKNILKRYDLGSQRIFVLRFVSWAASHDLGHKGLSIEMKTRIVNLLSSCGKLIISSESELPQEFEKYRIKIPPTAIHDLLYYADLYVGEGATMASEAVILGTFAVYINTLHLGYIRDQEKNGLMKHFDPNNWTKNENDVYSYIENLVRNIELKKEARILRQELLTNKINVSKWTLNFILNNSGLLPASNERRLM